MNLSSFFKFRLSTVFLLCSIPGMFFIFGVFHEPSFIRDCESLDRIFNMIFFILPVFFLIISFVASFSTLAVFLYRRQWHCIPQCLIEMAGSIFMVMRIPAY